MVAYTLDLRDRTGGALLKADVPFRALTARWVLNGPGSIEVEFRHDVDLGGAVLGTAELQLKRAGVVIWAGPWLSTDVDPRGRRIRITGEGLWWWFRQRLVTTNLVYSSVNQHTIAWNLLNHAQGQSFGSLGITQGTHTGANKARNKFYCAAEAPNVAEQVEAITEYENGIDFAVNPATRVFDTWTPRRQSASGISLSGSTVDSLSWSEDIREVRNFVTAIGADECDSILVTASDTGLATTYGRLHGAIDAEDSDDTKGEVTEVANEGLASMRNPRFDASVTFREDGTGAPAFASLIPGNTLLLSDSRGYSTFTNKLLRMIEVAVSLDNGLPGQAVYGLELSSSGV